MKQTTGIITLTAVLFTIGGQGLSAQSSNKDQAYEKAVQALRLETEGDFKSAISLLEEASVLDPEEINYPYEIGYAWYTMKEYDKAVEFLEPLKRYKNVSDQVYQLLGNSYDFLNRQQDAIETYTLGLGLFPESGKLHLELGVMAMLEEDYDLALEWYEKGIAADPTFASNYYWAARLYLAGEDEVWGMIYGELFMNLERNTPRTAEISKMLFDTYKGQIKFSPEGELKVGFCKNEVMIIVDPNDPSGFRLPFGAGVYEPTLLGASLGEDGISLESLNSIRTRFVESYYGRNNQVLYPNILFDYQKMAMDAGQLEAYNYWILLKGDEVAFNTWHDSHVAQFDAFVDWFKGHPIAINQDHFFKRY